MSDEELPKKNKLFVYNSLKKGFFWHNDYLGNGKSKKLGDYVTNAEYSLFIDALPFLVKDDSECGVKGEVYLVDDEVLKSIDRLESCPVFVKRDLIEVKNESGEIVLAWAHIHPHRFRDKPWVCKEFEWI